MFVLHIIIYCLRIDITTIIILEIINLLINNSIKYMSDATRVEKK